MTDRQAKSLGLERALYIGNGSPMWRALQGVPDRRNYVEPSRPWPRPGDPVIDYEPPLRCSWLATFAGMVRIIFGWYD